ncbi:MAG: 4Fe-4S dicluster domain-containing protein [Candidatus Bathyarchaeota archaeon]|nr:4Fe-4S dicluster domain-containing protein [Candidatus Bathyarchaeota archaeon]
MPPVKFTQRKFVSVDPSKCTGCGICELACSQEKSEASPLQSRIRVVRMKPLFNFALACRSCEDAKCVTACPEKALSQAEGTGVIMVSDKKCKGCDWCVQACEHGGITIHPETGLAVTCDLCGGEPQCVEFCPEEALELVATDEEAENRFNAAVEKMPAQCEELTVTVKNRDWKRLLAEAEERSAKVSEKLEALKKKSKNKKKPQ